MQSAEDISREPMDQRNTIRLVPTTWSLETVLTTLGLPDEVLADLAELDGSTNERMEAEQGRCEGISIQELVFGVPEARIINAAFSHAGLGVGRFHGSDRGAWYAGFDEATAIQEVRFHRARSYRDTRASGFYELPYRAFHADFAGDYHHLDERNQDCLLPEPIPTCYEHPRAVAKALLSAGSPGIVYPSVRNPGGFAIVCFRPALVFNVRRAEILAISLSL